jgi:hypothetical protein
MVISNMNLCFWFVSIVNEFLVSSADKFLEINVVLGFQRQDLLQELVVLLSSSGYDFVFEHCFAFGSADGVNELATISVKAMKVLEHVNAAIEAVGLKRNVLC